MTSDYYKIRSLQDCQNEDFELIIEWEVKQIAKEDISNGFIVQHMDIQSSNKSIPSNNYYEAWRVENGSVSEEDKGPKGDDIWNVPFTWIDKTINEITVSFSSKVYWIPSKTKEFDKIQKWERIRIVEASGLRAIQSIDWDIEQFFVCERNYVSVRNFYKNKDLF